LISPKGQANELRLILFFLISHQIWEKREKETKKKETENYLNYFFASSSI